MLHRIAHVDPPWDWKTWSDAGQGRSPSQHYQTQHMEWIKKLPIRSLLKDECCVFMWITGPLLMRGEEVLNAWGFEYSTDAFVWVKLNQYPYFPDLKNEDDRISHVKYMGPGSMWHMGNGLTTRKNPVEYCLLGFPREGSKPKRLNLAVRQLIVSEFTGKHSEKPEEVYRRIKALYGEECIDVFARRARPGWTCIGNEIDRLDIHESIRRTINE